MTALTCRWVPVKTLLLDSDLPNLIEQQWRELTHTPDQPPMPDWERAVEMNEAGVLRVWCAYLGRRLIGFIQFHFMNPLGSPHNKWAIDVGWYLTPEKRTGWRALQMWRTAEVALRALGIEIVRAHDNTKRPLPALFKRLGYVPVSIQYQKDLG